MAARIKSIVESALTEQSPRLKETMLKVLAELLEGEDAKAKQSGKTVLIQTFTRSKLTICQRQKIRVVLFLRTKIQALGML